MKIAYRSLAAALAALCLLCMLLPTLFGGAVRAVAGEVRAEAADEWDGATETLTLAEVLSACTSAENLYTVRETYGVSFGVRNGWDLNTRVGLGSGLETQTGISFNGEHLDGLGTALSSAGGIDYAQPTLTVGTPASFSVGFERIAYIEYTASRLERVTIEAATAEVTDAVNGALQLRIFKGDNQIYPESGWAQAAEGESIKIPALTQEMSAGDTLYLEFYTQRTQDEDGDGNRLATSVSFSYPVVFSVTERFSRYEHSYRHTDKWRQDENGDTINEVEFGSTDEETYPFLYEYSLTSGNDWGDPCSQRTQFALCETKRSEDWAKGALYGGGTMTGFSHSSPGGIASIDGNRDVNLLALTFVAPHAGEVRISDLYINYGRNYPNATNDYTIYKGESAYAQTFDGYRFCVLLNGVQIYPAEGGWDSTFTQKYEQPTNGYAAGDLIPYQEYEGAIDGIFVEEEDEVSLVFTRTNANNSRCDNCYLDAVFSLDEDVPAPTVKYLSSLDAFDLEMGNYEGEILSYYAYDVSDGLFGDAVARNILDDMDFASNTFIEYTDDFLADVVSVGSNSFTPLSGKDAVLVYTAQDSGNLTIRPGNSYRSADLALYRYYDAYYDLTQAQVAEVDGVRIRIEKNGERIWPVDKPWQEFVPDQQNRGTFSFDEIEIGVDIGDEIAIRVNSGAAGSALYDELNFSPEFILRVAQRPMAGVTVNGQNYTTLVADYDVLPGQGVPAVYIALFSVFGAVIVAVAVCIVAVCRRKKRT